MQIKLFAFLVAVAMSIAVHAQETPEAQAQAEAREQVEAQARADEGKRPSCYAFYTRAARLQAAGLGAAWATEAGAILGAGLAEWRKQSRLLTTSSTVALGAGAMIAYLDRASELNEVIAGTIAESRGPSLDSQNSVFVGPFSHRAARIINGSLFHPAFLRRLLSYQVKIRQSVIKDLRSQLGDREITPDDVSKASRVLDAYNVYCDERRHTLSPAEWIVAIATLTAAHRQ